MHHCLEVQEIFRNLLEIVFSDAHCGGRSLVALAVTCKAFSEPALDVLWRSQSSLTSLVKCMPADLWGNTQKRHYKRILTFKRGLVPRDWGRFYFYASRIRWLGYWSTHDMASKDTIVSGVYHALSIHKPEGPLLPNLHHLRWSGEDVDSFPYIHLFLGPRLLSLESKLIMMDPERSVDSLLSSVKTVSPRLQTLNLFGWAPAAFHNELSAKLCELVCGLPCLGTLYCGECLLTHDAIRHLAESTTLQTLSLKNTASDVSQCLSFNPLQSFFPSLLSLRIPTNHLDHVSILMRCLHAQRLRSIDITHTSLPLEVEMRSFFKTLTSCCSVDTFGAIHLHRDTLPDGVEGAWEPDDYAITGTTLNPLLAFRNMTIVEINVVCPFDLDDTALGKMALAWPKLKELHLGTSAGWGSMSGITLEGLIPLVANCPELDNLTIVIDAATRDAFPLGRPGGGVFNANIKKLKLGDSTLDNPSVVAAFLSDLFPELEDIFAWIDVIGDGDQGMWFDRWKEVERLLKVFINVRKQERNWKHTSVITSAFL